MKIKMQEQEFWYGGYVHEGINQPIGKDDVYKIDLRTNQTPNQSMPLFLSSKGRYLFGEKGFVISFDKGSIEVIGEVIYKEGFQNLKGAYLQAMSNHFPFDNNKLSMELFSNPIYNSWIELTFFQNEKDILSYAEDILNSGMPAGVLMIDDGWSDYYGKWSFNKEKFPDPKAMIQKLHSQGFHVMLWVSPYITPDTLEYRELRDKGMLIETKEGKPFITEWWNGYSAVLDFSNPSTALWLKQQLDQLCDIGVDGFKFDGGDSTYYQEDNVTYGNVTPDEQSLLWAKFGAQYSFNEYRVSAKAGGMSLLQRLCDKQHSWEENGIKSLIPNSLLQGITGHPFCSPDMIGGGEYLDFEEMEDAALDTELFIRHSEIACLMPAMQFSAAPYRVLNNEDFKKILLSIEIRKNYQSVIEQLVLHAKESGEPIIRYMTYEFPSEPVQKITDQFMLGSNILVAPITSKGEEGRKVYVPQGSWQYRDKVMDSEGSYHYFSSQQGEPIILEKK
ncbi:glycoside hydrolase family 31 protein [Virgibacillus sp. SK37]|uniref:glycoside hydrolase family 31 protein n=1 Tax=Virgibacillus sp. SK37 TaxID=403957 RepID=UPI0004D196EE|nr:glycoside hydrolase family 31 protein [Virgibacillus sp. SK37]AIF44583.1 glycoside hydrolase [Virgibacillus sp. SK37]